MHCPLFANWFGWLKLAQPPLLHSSTLLGGPQRRSLLGVNTVIGLPGGPTNIFDSMASAPPRLYARWTRPSDVSNACPALYDCTLPHPSSTVIVPCLTTL